MITKELLEDEVEVYGPVLLVIKEWRRLRRAHKPEGRGLTWIRRDERILELEILMIEQLGLTLPR